MEKSKSARDYVLSIKQLEVLQSLLDKDINDMNTLNCWVNHYEDPDIAWDLHVCDRVIDDWEFVDWLRKTLTAEELLDLMDKTIEYTDGETQKPVKCELYTRYHVESSQWFVEYRNGGWIHLSHKGDTLLEAAYNLLVYILSTCN